MTEPASPSGVRYTMTVAWSVEDERFIATVHALPGCVADGATRAEAVIAAEAMIATWVDVAQTMGRPVPLWYGDARDRARTSVPVPAKRPPHEPSALEKSLLFQYQVRMNDWEDARAASTDGKMPQEAEAWWAMELDAIWQKMSVVEQEAADAWCKARDVNRPVS
jgi:predicted RNase H-like HicB family nuclease